MGVERVDYENDDDYRQALDAEEEWERKQAESWELAIAPCYYCGEPAIDMGQPVEELICDKCKNGTQLEKLLLIHKKKK